MRFPVLIIALLLLQQPAVPRFRARVDAYRGGEEVSDADVAIQPLAVADTRGWPPEELEAAAMLHTDIGLRLVKAGRGTDASRHLDAAATLLRAAVTVDGPRVEYAIRWRDAVSSLLDAYGAQDLAKDLEARGHEWWPESKEAAAARKDYAQGLTHEIQAAVAGRLSGAAPTRPFLIAGDTAAALRHAAEDYTSALTSDPTDLPAALHLGRVVLLLGRDAEAIQHLRAASSSVSPAVRYLAFMFLGAIDERAGRLDAAIEQYRRGAAAFPWGQSAPLALSHALMRAGRDTDAREALADHFRTTQTRVCEPLWTYLADPLTDLGPTVDELRAEVWK